MRWIEAAFRAAPGKLDELCDRLTELGADGLVIEDEADFRRFLEENHQYWDYVDDELEARYKGVSRVKVYVEDSAEGKAKLARWTEALGAEPETNSIADEDWADNWKRYYKPIPVGESLLVLPKWEPEPEGNARKVLKLDPGLAFGTGGHATTRMCLELLEATAAGGERVLDLGCGSGILSIAALALGASEAMAVDIDPKAVDVAYENAGLNGIGRDKYTVLAGDILSDASLKAELSAQKYDVVLANIVADVIIPLSAHVEELLAPGGVFLCSGIIDTRCEEVRAALEKNGLIVFGRKDRDGWVAYAARF